MTLVSISSRWMRSEARMEPSLAIAIMSLVVSGFTAGWTIYRDAVQQPRFRVGVSISTIIQAGRPNDGPYIFVESLNLGPRPNRVGLFFAHKSWVSRKFWRDWQTSGMINPDWRHPATTKANTKIEVGDKAIFVFPYNAECFLREGFVRVGVSDGFGKTHWTPRKQLKSAIATYNNDFRQAAQVDANDPM